VARLWAGLAGVRSPEWNTYFTFLQNVHTGRRAYPISLSAGKSAGLSMSGAVHLLPLCAFMVWTVTTVPFNFFVSVDLVYLALC
jgi:hypothetical protein